MDDKQRGAKPPSTVAQRASARALVPASAVLLGLGALSSPAQAVTAVDDHYSTPVSTTLTGVNVLANDITSNSTPQVTGYSSAVHGIVNIQTNGDLTYQPNPGFNGLDQVFYGASDNLTNSGATVFIQVGPLPAPVPTLAPAAIGGLGALVALFGMRRRKRG